MKQYAHTPYRRDFRVDADEEDELIPAWLERPKNLPLAAHSIPNDESTPRTVSGMRISIHEETPPEGSSLSTRPSDTLLPPSSEVSKHVILVVGLDLVPTLSGKLLAAGFILSVAATVESAKRFSNEHIPAAIIVGSSSEPESHRFLHWIRNQRRLGFVQVFVLVSDDGPFCARDAIVAGADEILACPNESTDELEEAVDRIAARVARSQALAELSLLDPLTELHNRRFMNDRLPAEISRAARSGSVLSLAILDIDHFKSINDNFGHVAGDRALVAFSRVLVSSLRAYDIVCRFGGDEFVVLFPDCSRAKAQEALEQLGANTAWSMSDLPTATFSAGIAEFPEDGASWIDLFEAADTRIRAAKKLGPSHVVSRIEDIGESRQT